MKNVEIAKYFDLIDKKKYSNYYYNYSYLIIFIKNKYIIALYIIN